MEKKIFKSYEINMLIEIVNEQIDGIENHSISYGSEEDNQEWLNDWKEIRNKLNTL